MAVLRALAFALFVSSLMALFGAGLFYAGTRAQRDHDRECLRTDATWSDVMGCMNGEQAP